MAQKKNKVSNDDDDNKRTYTMGEYLLLAPDLITVKTNPPFNLLHKSDTLLRLTAFIYFFTYRNPCQNMFKKRSRPTSVRDKSRIEEAEGSGNEEKVASGSGTPIVEEEEDDDTG